MPRLLHSFRAIFGARQSLLEALLIKRRAMGPGWVLLQAPRRREGSSMVRGDAAAAFHGLPGLLLAL